MAVKVLNRIRETAAKLTVSERTVHRLIDEKRLKVVRVRGLVRITDDAINAYLRKCER